MAVFIDPGFDDTIFATIGDFGLLGGTTTTKSNQKVIIDAGCFSADVSAASSIS